MIRVSVLPFYAESFEVLVQVRSRTEALAEEQGPGPEMKLAVSEMTMTWTLSNMYVMEEQLIHLLPESMVVMKKCSQLMIDLMIWLRHLMAR